MNKSLIKLYELGEKDGVKFWNAYLPHEDGATFRKDCFTLIYISIKLGEHEEYIVLAHEMGHFYMDCATAFSVPVSKMIDESRADGWKAAYLVPRDKYLEVMRNPFVYSDFEAAEELGVDIESIVRIREAFKAQGLPVSQAELGCEYREP